MREDASACHQPRADGAVAAFGPLLIIERDNQLGENARVKRITRVPLEGLKSAPVGGDLPTATVEGSAISSPASAPPAATSWTKQRAS